MPACDNPLPIPNRLDLEVYWDPRLDLIRQRPSGRLREALDVAYQLGMPFGTPLDDDTYGSPYTRDFLEFILQQRIDGNSGLEIGAGTGFLMRQLDGAGFKMIGLESGSGYLDRQRFHEVEVIAEEFPSRIAEGPYNLIVAYGVLEHIENPEKFLSEVADHLAPKGTFCISVPNCTDEIVLGDYSMLAHEHYSYFDIESLSNLLTVSGLRGEVRPSLYGRTLYAACRKSNFGSTIEHQASRHYRESYDSRALSAQEQTRRVLRDYASHGTIGLFVAARALFALDDDLDARFFDDDPKKLGCYYPPFKNSIESRADLLSYPVQTLINFSRTFAAEIHSSLRSCNFRGKYVNAWEASRVATL
jgi:2-polyprenyl-3-methyl-5-hydroxy-6-metoxy-1,4-benzoquinol methylase